MSELDTLYRDLERCPEHRRDRLRRRLDGLARRARQGKPIDRGLKELTRAIHDTLERVQRRRAALPAIDYPEQLPVSARRAEIAAAIAENQVVVVAGETGSGKTTQLPKICLELGRGVDGLIGHTQPRRIAARSVAKRIAEELKSEPGRLVGYKVRFSDHTSSESLVKLMTDGILLAEIQHDPLLSDYDTIIIDEAHERSLNIDFLLGYLRQLLPKRPDLKLIITSATINTEGFSKFFGDAPVVEVSGRSYPVDILYRPLMGEDEDDRDRDLPRAILDAVDELARLDPLGDILIFLPGEREIRAVNQQLTRHAMRDTEVVPLFSRLSTAEQDRVFRTHRGRRIVLATNVAETSLTVPGIRFVIDSGLARISRYSHRTKVQRLPIEAIAQSSANQRAGRCGRLGPGTCIRLFAEEDYAARPLYTDPEIRRTNLASVILQMAALGLGDVEAFPFMDPPDRRYITDGYRLLEELQAVDGERRLTAVGKKLVRLPLDPRLGRMLLAAEREGVLPELLIIASALAVQDPRSRPMDAQQKSDQRHAEFSDKRSDFISYLNLWNWFREQSQHLSNSKLRKTCHDRYLSYVRLREWHDIHSQLLSIVRELKLELPKRKAPAEGEEPSVDGDGVHRALLAGLLGNIAMRDEEKSYIGARNIKLNLFPGSGLYKKPPKWLVAAELVETSKLYARTVGMIRPEWLEPIARHLLKRSYSEPHWEKRPAQVAAFERVTLYGLPIVTQRKVNYGPLDPPLAREIFIRQALVQGDFNCRAKFFRHNAELIAEVERLEAKARRRDVMVDDEVLFAFYDARIPEGIYSGKSFDKWLKGADEKALYLSRDDLLQRETHELGEGAYPDHFPGAGLSLPLEYHFEPGGKADGISVVVPLAALGQLPEAPFEWLVPGMLEEKLIALIKSLPKSLRRNFVPAVNFAQAALAALVPYEGSLREAFAHQLLRITGVTVPADAWQLENIPEYLRINFRVIDEKGKPLAEGRELAELQRRLSGKVRDTLSAAPEASEEESSIERTGIVTWDFAELPDSVELKRAGLSVRAYPALVDEGEAAAIRLFESPVSAATAMSGGLHRLYSLALRDKLKYLRKNIPDINTLCLRYNAMGNCEALKDDLLSAVIERLFLQDAAPRDKAEFEQRVESGRARIIDEGNRIAAELSEALKVYHELQKRLKKVPPTLLQAASDIQLQLQRLLGTGFIAATPARWLSRLPLYLRAAEARLEKAARDPSRDRANMLELQKFWELYEKRHEQLNAQGRVDAGLEEFRWLLEELRISFWAQELKTLEPVSVKRLQKRWKELAG